MQNSLSGFQILAGSGLQNGEGITPPNISANLSSYSNFAPVANFSNIYSTASLLPFGLTSANANLLLSIGANTFPQVFGQVPNEFSSNLGNGPLFSIAPARTIAWFGGSPTANIYIQTLSQAQSYAAAAQAVISSAATTQWSGGPASSATGGFSAIGGNDPIQFQNVANVISELGTLMVPTDPFNGFSNADCFNRILEAGNDTIGNLHLTFFGKNIIDPTTGNTWIIGSDLFSYILDNPVVVTQTISSSLNLGNISLDVYHFINGLVTNISGLTNIPSMTALGLIMSQISPLTNSSNLLALSSPISQSQFSNIQSTFGPGSGTYGNPTVDDILGSTNYNGALTDTISGLITLTTSTHYANISSDTSNISSALVTNIFPVTLSDGSIYGNINSLAIGGSTLVNQNAANLANIAPSLTNVSVFSSYNNISETHNNSITLSNVASSFSPINTVAMLSGATSDFPKVSGLVGLVLSIIHKYYGASQIVKIDNPPQSAMFQRIPGSPNFSPSAVLGSFPSSLAAMAALSSQIPNADEISGLNNITNCIDMTSITGQALNATVKEAQNAQVLSSGGIISQAFATNPISLVIPKF